MSRGKWIIAFLCVPAALLGAAILRSGHICGRLQAEGAETKAVLTGCSSRVGFVGYRPHGRRYREKHAVCCFDYRYEVGGQAYTGKVRKKRTSIRPASAIRSWCATCPSTPACTGS
ncbi:MAG: hypothetical protein ACLR93_09850 [Alistipes onderdonkii]